MDSGLRAFLAVCAGVMVGLILISIGHAISPYQPAEEIDYNNATAYADWFRSLPGEAFGIILVIFLIATFAGGFVTGWITPPVSFPPSFVTGFTLLFYNIVTVLAFPNPFWMSVSTCVGCVAMGLLGGWVAKRMKRR